MGLAIKRRLVFLSCYCYDFLLGNYTISFLKHPWLSFLRPPSVGVEISLWEHKQSVIARAPFGSPWQSQKYEIASLSLAMTENLLCSSQW